MNGLESLLATRASFVLAALVVSWAAVALLALVAANLHLRLVRLERAAPGAASARTPFGHLLGRDLAAALGGVAPGTRFAVVLSADCATCDRVLARLRDTAGGLPLALVWRYGAPSPLPPLPAGARVVADGREVSRALGVRVTPFALVAGADGRIVRTAAIGSVAALDALLAAAADPAPAATPAAAVSRSPRPSLKGALT